MNAEQLKHALSQGQQVFGTLIVSPSPHWPKALAGCGLDFVFIDTEHIAIDRHELSWMCRAYNAANLAPLVRIPSPDSYHACQVIDGGAAGIVAPYVESVEEARELVGAVKLRPLKGAKLRRVLEGKENPGQRLQAYLDQYNGENVLIVNIESMPALDNLDELMMVPGLDGILIGPHDLSCSMGLPEDYSNRVFRETVWDIITRARAAGLCAGAHVTFADTGLAEEISYIREAGANLVIHSGDIVLFRRALAEDLAVLRNHGGKLNRPEGQSVSREKKKAAVRDINI